MRVAIVGSGPSGFYAAAALLGSDRHVRVDLLDRLPTPFGLVRGGVAPDHQKIKSVVRAYDKTAGADGFRFMGNVDVGRDVTVPALLEAYDQVVLAVGNESARRLGIEGSQLEGTHTATAFVAWYNGHPDHQHHAFDLSCSAAVVVGVGNVAMDVARVLAQDPERLASTDITDTALHALRASQIRDVYVLGRRGPAQAAFSPSEIKEIGELEGVDLIVRPEDAALDPASAAWLEAHGDKQAKQNCALLAEHVGRPSTAPRRVHVRLHTSPVRFLGDGALAQVELGTNRLEATDGGRFRAVDTGERARVAAGISFEAVGYRGVPLPDVPFDDRRGTIPNVEGRVTTDGTPVPRLYVVGWAKRGPSGLIGTNRADSKATVAAMLEDVAALPAIERPDLPYADAVDWDGWQRIDQHEVAAGQAKGKIRDKVVDVDALVQLARE
ncbi:MAG: FAD-dependent oxidoreductase [Myxococcales bacterium]|nr:FAD-dependent oxidoreductase [Myxococcales bacterium]